MNQASNSPPRLVSSDGARQILGIHPSTFARLDRAGVFRRFPRGYETASLMTNLAKALEVEREAKEKIAAIEEETRRRLAELGAAELAPRQERISLNSNTPLSPLNPSEVSEWQV